MKKALAMILALAFALALAGCGTSEPLLEGVSPAETGSAEDAAALSADFTVALFNAAYEGGDSLISPVSVLAALAMAESGARGETLAQMEELFGVDAETLRASLAAYMSSVAGTEAKIANAIWFRDDGTFEPDAGFLSNCASFAGAEAFAGKFTDALAGEINGWVSEHTEGMIDAIVDEIDPDAVMYLVNALSFAADWQEQYEEYQMRPGVFHSENGELEVTMMRSEERSYISGEGFTGFMKPYEGGRYAFAALLPDGDSSLEAMLASLTGKALAEALAGAEDTAVDTATPKFSGESSFELSGALKAMGMTDAFDGGLADFSGMGQSGAGNIFISRVLHRAFIEVDGLGTRAGAATAVEAPTASMALAEDPPEVILDRPFAYMIVDREYNIPLFFGVVTGEGF